MQPDKAGTASAFPADHLAGTKADRVMGTKDGLTAWEAIQLLCPEREPETATKEPEPPLVTGDSNKPDRAVRGPERV